MAKAKMAQTGLYSNSRDLLKLGGTFGKEEGIIFLGEDCPYMSIYKKKILCIDAHGFNTRSS